jgi:hypothetical protein
MKRKKGVFIHPRQGLQQPYLSVSFLEMVDAARPHLINTLP